MARRKRQRRPLSTPATVVEEEEAHGGGESDSTVIEYSSSSEDESEENALPRKEKWLCCRKRCRLLWYECVRDLGVGGLLIGFVLYLRKQKEQWPF